MNSALTVSEVEAIVIEDGWRELVIVRLRDTDGRDGFGEATLKEKAGAVAQAVMGLTKTILDHDAGGIEAFFQRAYLNDHWRGGVVHTSAISAIETAMWDLLGKRAGMPVWQLLGGRVHDRIKLYANGWFRSCTTRSEVRTAALRTVEQGYTGLKWNPFLRGLRAATTPSERRSALRAGALEVREVRDEVGPDVDLLVECHGLLTKEEALLLCEAVIDADPLFVEEPTHPDDSDSLSWIVNRSNAPVAMGERWFTRWDYLSALRRAPVAIIQPDLCHCGGMSELKKIAGIGEASGAALAPHNSAGPLATVATAHVCSTCPNFLILESFVDDKAWERGAFVGDYEIDAGHLVLSDAPGIGIEPDLALLAPNVLQRHRSSTE